MTDSTLNRFLARGTDAQRLAFTPTPATPASGPSPTYFWLATDTGVAYAYDGSAWVGLNASLAWSAVTGAPTTLSGYGITDAYTKTSADARYLQISNNLSDVIAATARTNLGLGTAATLASDTDTTLAANSDSNLATQKAVKGYVDSAIAGLSWKQAVRVATTVAGTLASSFENGDTVDGVVLATGNRILIKNQASGAENGLYVVNASGAPTRATDADSGAELVNASCYVSEGTTNADTQWTCSTNATITVGSTSLAFTQMATGGGSSLTVKDEGSTLTSAATSLDFVGAGVTATNSSGAVTVTIPSGSGALIGVQTITATGSGTYTPTTGTNSIVIELQGAGGGGAAGASPGSGNAAVCQGGSAGGYLRKRLTANFSGASYSVGAKGAGGAAGANNGANGGNTTFTDTAGSPTVYTAGGGTGGTQFTGAASAGAVGASNAGGSATNGDINASGGPSGPVICHSTAFILGGAGGASHYSGGAPTTAVGSANSGNPGTAASGKGGGGAGAAVLGTGTAKAGGDGSDGVIIIWEYS